VSEGLSGVLKALGSGRDLNREDTQAAVAEILEGDAPEADISALLMGLRVKGETILELAGAVNAVRERMIPFGQDLDRSTWIDTCGTGGDGANTLNVSTATAIVVAACGVKVAKHGNRSASGNSGSAEVLTEMGIDLQAPDEIQRRCISQLGIVFLLAPRYHPGLRHAAAVRKRLPFRTIFNLVGPLANPASPPYQLVGVSGERQADLVAGALADSGAARAAVVTGPGGLDEVALEGTTRVLVVEETTITERGWTAHDFGLDPVSVEDLRVSSPVDSAARISHLLAGEPGPSRDVVLANAAAALWVVGDVELRAGVARAAEAIDSGRARSLVDRWREMSRDHPA
jgi:anthranilate phosphoribosyltransferase